MEISFSGAFKLQIRLLLGCKTASFLSFEKQEACTTIASWLGNTGFGRRARMRSGENSGQYHHDPEISHL